MRIRVLLAAAVLSAMSVLFAEKLSAQVVKPPYILGKNDVRIKSKNFLAGRKAKGGSVYSLFNSGFSIEFDKRTNEFEIVTGAASTNHGLRLAQQDLRKAETILLRITGVASGDRCKLKILMRIVMPGSTDGGLSYDHLPSCGEF